MSDAGLAVLGVKLRDPVWRLSNLYKILDADGQIVTFTPNEAQLKLLKRLHNRNLIMKARQMGFTTLIQMLALDTALFTPHCKVGVIAHRLEDCERILRDKIKFAYERLPDAIRAVISVEKDDASEVVFSNGSGVRVSTSMRSATLQFLHISEFAKIAKAYPIRAREIITGTLPAIQSSGIVVIESTAEGAEGEFYRMCQEAIKLRDTGREISPMEYRVHFFPWWADAKYVANPEHAIMSEGDRRYFDELEGRIGRALSPERRAWYILKRTELGDQEKMWQEFPSTEDEAFMQSTEGCYYSAQMADARKQGRIRSINYLPGQPVNTFWDLGADDSTAIWFHQQIGPEHRFLRYHEASGEDLAYYMQYLQQAGYVYGTHYLPHDATHKRLSGDSNKSIEDMLRDLGLTNTQIVPRIDNIQHGIEATRRMIPHCYFDESGCKDGITHIDLYRKDWDARLGVWKAQPRHDSHSHGADAFRQAAQVFDDLLRANHPTTRRRSGSWRVA